MTERVAISDEEASRIMQAQQQKEEQSAAVTEQRESLLRAFVSGEGRERLAKVAQVKPERAQAVEIQVINLVRQGKLQPPVGDDTVRELLAQAAGVSGGSGGANITVIRKRNDDDW